MKDELIAQLQPEFESSAHVTEEGVEFWLARDLQRLLGYADWGNFQGVIERAKAACQNSNQEVADHFGESAKMVEIGSGSRREVEDVALTRYACYLVAQNGDPTKDQIAFAQTYFALQTRKQELIAERLAQVERLNARNKLTLSEKELSGLIYERLGDGMSFARIRSKGDRALFGGQTTQDMKKKLGVPADRALADFLPTITIKAKDFANELTNVNVKKNPGAKTEAAITDEHIKNNTGVRGLLNARGIAPEALPPAEDAKKVERRVNSDNKRIPKAAKRPSLPPPDPAT